MRYFLLAVGLLGLGVTGWSLTFGPAFSDPNAVRTASLFFQASAILFAAGAVGVDIVLALKNRPQ